MKVLYIDWEDKIREYVSMVLEMGMDAEILEAASIGDAFTIIEIEDDFDIIICEARLKNGKASELIEFMDKNKFYKPLIWLSEPKNKDLLVVKETMSRSEAFSFVPKPFKDDEFFPVVEKMLSLSISEEMFKKSNALEEIDDEEWEKALAQDPDADWSLLMKKKDSTDDSLSLGEKEKSPESADETEIDLDEWAALKPSSQNQDSSQESLQEKEKKEKKLIKVKIPREEIDLSEWRRIKAKRLLTFNPVQADIFIRLKSDKYLKLIHKSDEYDHERIQRYMDKGVVYFYVKTEQYRGFLGQFEDKVFQGLEMAQSAPSEVKAVVELACVDNIIEITREFGLDEQAVRRVDNTIQSIIKTVDKRSGLFQLLQSISKGNNYVSQHSLMLSYICNEIVKGTPWGGHASVEKLSLASLLHDSALDIEELAVEHDKENDLKCFEKEAQDMIKEHMGKAAQILSQAKGLYPDVDSIILQHHERPDGSGYPRGLAANMISPLSAVFIISEDLTQTLFKKKKSEINFKELSARFEREYKKGNFKKPLEAALKFINKVA